ncbi:methyltransferase domain-containing protein [Candidatus Woesearchaeota archaeon]|nr:methyltransferase domain-containing protein [Candidatus Woesearchaeota archaeon]
MNKSIHYNQSNIENSYSKFAWMYDLWSNLTESKAFRRVLEFISIKDGESILEIAVGTGILFEQIVRLNPKGRNEGLDLSESMLKKARIRLMKYKHFNLIHGDASRLPYNSNTFDILVNNYMLDLLPSEDYLSILREFKRVLKPGGKLVITTMTNGKEWYSKIWDFVAKIAPSLLTGCRPVNLRSIIKSSGFKLEKSEYLTQNTFPSLIIYARK